MDADARKRLVEKVNEAKGDRSQRDFAKDLDVGLATVQNWLKGYSLPLAHNYEKIAAALGMSKEDFFSYIMSGEVGKGDYPPATPNKAEDVRMYASILPVEEKIRLLSMIGEDIAIQAQGDSDR